MIELDKINISGGTQARAELNQSVVAEYADIYKAGGQMPAVIVFFDGSEFWLADGFHRFFGAKQAGNTEILEERILGTKRDAVLYSLSAIAHHGLRRTNADKRRAVETLLNDAEWAAFSDRKISEICSVAHSFVAAIRKPEVAEKQQANRDKSAVKKQKVESDSTPVQKPVELTQSQKEWVAEYDHVAAEAEEMKDAVRALAEENDSLKDRLSIAVMDGTEEEKKEASETIESLRSHVRALEAEVSALRASRDKYQRDNADMKIQLAAQRKQIAKLQKVAA